ncbi:MAG TPA: RNA polymerase sigma factor [Terriglobales bacterium]|nr:RNA polymerase sigma factor [Terriglobales bacterium]
MAVRRPAKGSRNEASGLPGDERVLVEAAKKDPSRFADLYELNFARVYAYIARRVGDRDVAQDLTSDVFHKALASIQSFEWRGVPFAGWLLRIAANMIVDRSKRSGREVSGQDNLPEPSSEASTQLNLEEIDYSGRLFRLVEQLPADQQRVIGMHFAEEKSIREIAMELGRSEGAVKQLQFRALQNLRAQMEGAHA